MGKILYGGYNRHTVYLALDGEWAYESGTQFATGQSELSP